MDWTCFRHLLHECAEKSGEEWLTRSCLLQELKHHTGELIECEHSPSLMMLYSFQQEKTIMLRAEMDGLGIQEETGLDYCSKTPSVMHACGHDGHMAILCSVSQTLSQLTHFPVNVLLVFQSAEESGAGALNVLKERRFLEICPDMAIALHVMPGKKRGFYTRKGAVCAGGREVDVWIHGTPAHCALRRKQEDALIQGTRFLNKLDHMEWEHGFLSFNVLHAGKIRNQTAELCRIEGTARFLDNMTESQLLYWLKKNLPEISELKLSQGYPVLCCHGRMSEAAFRSGCHVLDSPLWICDDFAFYAQRIPSVYVLMGMESEIPLHHPLFDFDDALIEMGSEFLINFMQETQNN